MFINPEYTTLLSNLANTLNWHKNEVKHLT